MTRVTLLDGSQADCASEAWRHECEARWLANRPTRAERAAYLEDIAKRRGAPAAEQLRSSVSAMWAHRKTAEPRTPASGTGDGASVLREQPVATPALGPSWSVSSAGDSNRSVPLGDGSGA